MTGSHRFAYLLAAILALIVLYPMVGAEDRHPGLFGIFSIAVFMSALRAIAHERRILIA